MFLIYRLLKNTYYLSKENKQLEKEIAELKINNQKHYLES